MPAKGGVKGASVPGPALMCFGHKHKITKPYEIKIYITFISFGHGP